MKLLTSSSIAILIAVVASMMSRLDAKKQSLAIIMDNVLLLNKEGKPFNLEPPNTRISAIFAESSGLASYESTLNRISNAEWCFWAISADLEVKLFVYDRDEPIQVNECVVESQRRHPIPYKSPFSDKLNPATDPANFSSPHDEKSSTLMESFLLPSFNWCWVSDWFLVDAKNQKEGWSYAVDFKSEFRPDPFWYANVRRRIWVKRRIFITYEKLILIDSPFSCEFVNELSVGGWSMPNNNIKGYLSVWIASNSGRVFYRKNVSYSNPEGTEWIEVDLSEYNRASTITCTESGSFWVVTHDGCVLLRSDVSSSQPMGRRWIELKHPNGIHFVSVAANSSHAFALDNRGCVFFRDGMNECQEGTKWVKILKGLRSISLSKSNQLWALANDRRTLYIGSKLDDVSSRSFCWRTVYLPDEFDFIDAKVACDYLDDLAVLSIQKIV